MLQDPLEASVVDELNEYKRDRGLWGETGPMEVKWVNAGEEAKSAAKSGLKNRYEGYLDVFFKRLRAKQLSFGYLFLSANQYASVEPQFTASHQGGKHAFFFMLYFQFLYHCFIKTQTGHKPTRIFVDERDMGAEGVSYDIADLRDFLNKRLSRQAAPRFQLPLGTQFRKFLENSIDIEDLENSKAQPLIQLADLCAGCVRYALENRIPPPLPAGQIPLFETGPGYMNESSPKASLATYFYSSLRTIVGYGDIDLAKPSYHHRFSIFPFTFDQPP